jgi:2'-5' RNA ligase
MPRLFFALRPEPAQRAAVAAALAVQALARTLAATARAGGITLDDRPFRAHVTVARKVSAAASRARRWPQPLASPLPFTANGFVLMESTREPDGPRYKVIHAWPSAPDDV